MTLTVVPAIRQTSGSVRVRRRRWATASRTSALTTTDVNALNQLKPAIQDVVETLTRANVILRLWAAFVHFLSTRNATPCVVGIRVHVKAVTRVDQNVAGDQIHAIVTMLSVTLPARTQVRANAIHLKFHVGARTMLNLQPVTQGVVVTSCLALASMCFLWNANASKIRATRSTAIHTAIKHHATERQPHATPFVVTLSRRSTANARKTHASQTNVMDIIHATVRRNRWVVFVAIHIQVAWVFATAVTVQIFPLVNATQRAMLVSSFPAM